MQRGFTLIELLIVIAIIGVLVAIVLGGINIARSKARDNGVRNDIRQMRWLAEEAYNSNGADYTDWNLDTGITDRLDILLNDLDKHTGHTAPPDHATRICATQQHDYCISAPLASDASQYFCVDATGRFVHTGTPCPETCPDADGAPLVCVTP